MRATIVKSTGSWYQALSESGVLLSARIRGKFRMQSLDTSNPVAVGDEVELEMDENYQNTASISEIYPRRNYVIRKSNKLSSKRQVLAANLDLAVMVASIIAPRTSLGFIDRFLVCCEAYHIPVIIFFNKTDLLSGEGIALLEEIMQIYQNAGYMVYSGNATEVESLQSLHQSIKGKTIMEVGHSGVGKSTILNQLFPSAAAKVQSISVQHEVGKHTTTFAEMHVMPDGTRIVDTPGIRDFGVVDVPENEIGQYFPEFRRYSLDCKFNDCQHTNEPDCAIKLAVENGKIAEERYFSYLSILRGEDVFE